MSATTLLLSALFALAGAVLALCATSTRRRQSRPGYAPPWAVTYVMMIIVGMTAYGLASHILRRCHRVPLQQSSRPSEV
jgi:drug/metabolite transporter (DMT)-like permease